MSDGASPLLTIILMSAAFGGGFLLLLFMLWASGRSPIVRIAGELAANLLYLAMALLQAWNARGADDATVWKAVSATLAVAAAFNAFRFAKSRQKSEFSPPDGTAKP
ncbi:hypothetical protein [Caulobacter sp. DWR2-3-1b2]|uniref:hypothetical protein n=1 Tax=unclassified Caulobacter TaxID=2648921 RepID=UPI003CEF0C34